MRKISELLSKIPLYYISRAVNFTPPLPFNYTLSLTYRCNSRCKTCNIWKIQKDIPSKLEMNTESWIKTIKSFGKSPFWITLSGGEPFLRNDVEKIIGAISKYNSPFALNIPTNALIDWSNRIKNILEEKLNEKTFLIVNFSLDGIGRLHDFIRGVKGNWERFLKSYKSVRKLKFEYTNLVVGIHTVISKWNVKKLPEIYDYVTKKLKPDQYILEIAENRKELGNINESISPSSEEFKEKINWIIGRLVKEKHRSISKLTNSFRIEYYKYVRDVICGKRNYIPSYAGFASVHITPLGEVWDCAILGNELGKLKDFDYNFKKLWKNKEIQEVRNHIKKSHKCILANEFYSNALFDIKIISHILFHNF